MYVKITLFLRNAQFQRYMVIWYVIITLDLLQVFLNNFFRNRIPHYFDIHVVRSVTVTLLYDPGYLSELAQRLEAGMFMRSIIIMLT